MCRSGLVDNICISGSGPSSTPLKVRQNVSEYGSTVLYLCIFLLIIGHELHPSFRRLVLHEDMIDPLPALRRPLPLTPKQHLPILSPPRLPHPLPRIRIHRTAKPPRLMRRQLPLRTCGPGRALSFFVGRLEFLCALIVGVLEGALVGPETAVGGCEIGLKTEGDIILMIS